MTTAELPRLPAEALERDDRVLVRVWDLVVRGTHWLIALSMLVLAVTGIYIGRPFIEVSGPAREHFVMGTMKVVHFYAAIVFALSVVTRIAWMFMGSRYASWRCLVPVTRKRWRGVLDSLRFYLFLRKTPADGLGHNPLAGIAYVGVFGLYLLMIATGLALYAVGAHVDSPFRIFAFLIDVFGSAQTARWIHHVVTWLLVLFVLQHVYSALLTAVVEKTGIIDAIFTGNKWATPEQAREHECVGGRRA